MPRPAPASDVRVRRLTACFLVGLIGLLGASTAWAQISIGAPASWGKANEWARGAATADAGADGAAATPPAPPSPQEREAQARREWYEQRLAEKVSTLGEHRRAEAIRQVELEENSRRARGINFASDAPVSRPPAATVPPPAPTPRQPACRAVDDGVQKTYAKRTTRAEATAAAQPGGLCSSRGGAVGFQISCHDDEEFVRKPQVVDGKLQIVRKSTGVMWSCSGTFRCAQPRQVCDTPSGATRQ